MGEEGSLRYVKWEECTKRDQELQGLKTDPIWKPDVNGVIKECRVQEVLKAEYNTDLKLRYALQRRSLAFDQARIVDYDDFEAWTQVLLQAFTDAPPDGYAKLTLEQVHRADLELFKYIMRETRNGIKNVNGAQPMADALKAAIRAPEVRLCLQPLPSGSKRKADAIDDVPKKSTTKSHEQYERQIENLKNQVANLQKRQGQNSRPDKNAGKAKGRGKSRIIRLPPQLIGMSPTTASGEPICYNFNLNGCTAAKPGEKCDRGWHLCMRPNCQKAHSQRDHPVMQ